MSPMSTVPRPVGKASQPNSKPLEEMGRPGPGAIKIFSGNANPPLARAICEYLKVRIANLAVVRVGDIGIRF